MVMLDVGNMLCDLDVNVVDVIILARLGSEVSDDVSDDVDEFLDGDDGLWDLSMRGTLLLLLLLLIGRS